jgi:hypothetical protein
MRQRVHRAADISRPYRGVSHLAEVLTVVCRKGMTAETAMRKCAGRKPRTTMMAAAEMCEAMTACEMTACEMTACEMTASEMTATEMTATEMTATEMPSAAKMAATTTAVTASAASTERRARQRGHNNQSGNRDTRPPHGTLPRAAAACGVN